MARRSGIMVEMSEDRTLHRYLVLLSTLAFLVLTVAVLIVYGSPMRGYEYSIYNSTPLVFWLAIIFCQLTGVLMFYVYYGSGRKLWAIGLFQILLANFVLMTLYLYKGFIYIERTDSMSYVGYAKEVLQTGYFPLSNFYPFASIMMSMTGSVMEQGMILMSQVFPAIFFTAYTVGILCWSRTISPKPMFVTSMMLASMPIFFAWFIPTLFNQTLCVLMLPFFFFILWRCRDGHVMFKVLLGLFIVFFTLGHPLVAMTVLLFLAVVWGTELLTKRETRSITPCMILFGAVLLFGWIVFHSLLVSDLRNIVEQLLGLAEGMSTYSNASAQMSQMGILSTLQSILVCTIDDIIFALISLVAGILILKRGWRTHPMTVLAALFVIGGTYLVAIVFFTFAHNPFRLINLNFIMIFTIPLVGYVLYTFREQDKKKLARLVSVVIVFCLVSTVFTVYQDPNTVFPNGSITKAEVSGVNWLVTEKDSDYSFYVLQTKPWRYTDLTHGAQYKRDNYDLIANEQTATYHFSSFLNVNDTSGLNAYLVLSTYEEMAYSRTWAAANKYNFDDFHQLMYRPTVNQLYEAGDMKVYSRSW